MSEAQHAAATPRLYSGQDQPEFHKRPSYVRLAYLIASRQFSREGPLQR